MPGSRALGASRARPSLYMASALPSFNESLLQLQPARTCRSPPPPWLQQTTIYIIPTKVLHRKSCCGSSQLLYFRSASLFFPFLFGYHGCDAPMLSINDTVIIRQKVSSHKLSLTRKSPVPTTKIRTKAS
jgi:hypothetical protein